MKSTSGPTTATVLWPGDTPYDDLDDEEFDDGLPERDI